MFKSIQARLVLLFVLTILSVMMTVGTFVIGNVTRFYYSSFITQMTTSVFDDDFLDKIQDAFESESNAYELKALLDASSGRIGVDSYRKYAILDGENGSFVIGFDELDKGNIEISNNILDAISGKVGDKTHEKSKFIDFAYPLIEDGSVTYIIYVYETKDELNDFSKSMFATIFQSLVLGLIIAVILGYLLSRTITKPIKNLTSRANKMAEGNFEVGDPSYSEDEIGTLTNTFRSMAKRLKETIFEVANQNTKLETVLEYSSDGIAAFDTRGNLILINHSAKIYLSIEDEDIDFDGFFNPIFDDITLGDFLYLQKSTQIIKETNLNNYYLRFHFGTFMYSDDKIGGIIVDVQNITKEQKFELSRREFVANVSHELRTPLTTVKAYIETMLDSNTDEETRNKFLNTVNNETDRMTRLVSDLLTLSRLDNGVTKLNLTRMRIEKIMNDVRDKLQFEAQNKNQTLTYKMTSEIPNIPLDRDKMEQVITNIVSNAIKYTGNDGSIEMYSGFISGKATIRVRDNGMGIPSSDIERIFERFYRVDKARSREQGGTGLGLAIAKEIINAHAGEISIASKLNEGTEITITLPVEKTLSDEVDHNNI